MFKKKEKDFKCPKCEKERVAAEKKANEEWWTKQNNLELARELFIKNSGDVSFSKCFDIAALATKQREDIASKGS